MLAIADENTNEWNIMKKKSPIKYYIYLAMASFALFGSNVSLLVFFKRMADDMLQFSYFVYLLTSFGFVIVFFILKNMRNILYVLYSKFVKNIESPKGRLPHYQYFILGLLDATKGILIFLSAHRTAANLQPILPNISIFITFVMSYIIMKYKFKIIYFFFDFLASFIVFIGIIISLVPVFINIANSPESILDTGLWPILFAISIVPASIMFILQEKFSKHIEDIDYFELNMWISIYQAIICIFYFWVNFIFPSINIYNLQDLGASFDNGFLCLAGYNITLNSTTNYNLTTNYNSTIHENLNCQFAAIDIVLYIGSYIGTYLSSAILLRMITSLFVSLLNVCVTPVTIIIFSIIGMDTFNIFTAISLPVMIIGIIINVIVDYKRNKLKDNKSKDDNDETIKLI